MSTYYYMSCEDHKIRTRDTIAVSRLAGQHLDSQENLLNFLMKHKDCCLKFFSEHDDERYEYEKECVVCNNGDSSCTCEKTK